MGLLADVILHKLKNHWDEVEGEREAADQVTRMIGTLGAMQGNRTMLERHQKELTAAYGKEGYERILTASDVIPTLMGIAKAGDKALAQKGLQPPDPLPGVVGRAEQFGATPEMLPEPMPGEPIPPRQLQVSGFGANMMPQWKFSDAKIKAQAVTETRKIYDFFLRTNPNIAPQDAWAKALDHIEDKYDFIPPTDALEIIEPDFKAARDKRWFRDVFESARQMLGVDDLNAKGITALQKNLALTYAAQGHAAEGHIPDMPDAQKLIFGDIYAAQNIQEAYETARVKEIAKERGLEAVSEQREERLGREAETEVAARQYIQTMKELAPAMGIMARLKGLVFGDQERGVEALLPDQGGFNRFAVGLKRYGQAFWQTDMMGIRAKSYMTLRKAFLAQLVRTFGDRGMLTNQDIERIADALPSFFDTQAIAQLNLGTIESILRDIATRVYTLKGLPPVGDIIGSVDNGLALVDQIERKYFKSAIEQSLGEKVDDNQLDKMLPKETIEFDIDGNEVKK